MSAAGSARRIGALVAVWACLCSVPATAQYFGQNKVQYHQLNFEVLKTEHFDIYVYPNERQGVDLAARLAERWHARLERLLEHRLSGRQPLILYGSHADFEQTNVIGGELSEGTGGVTEPVRRRIVLPLAGPLADTDHVIGHELVHAFQFDMTARPGAGPGENGAERLPLWFIEGMAEYLSLGPVDPNTAMWLRDAARREQLPSIKELNDSKYFPYRWGQAFWAYVAGRWGDRVVGTMLLTAAASGSTDTAIQTILDITPAQLSSDWQAAIRKTYGGAIESSNRPAEGALLVIKGKEFGGSLNIGPSISPDGKWIAFLSERGMFSIDVYLAEANTGRVVQKLTSTATDPHFSSIQFIYSAGAWDRGSTRFVVATVTGGHPALDIFNAPKGSKEKEIAVTGVDEILNPTWSPDGKSIAFAGMKQGLTDLFLYDLTTGSLRQLTDDAYADLHPAWSPDGRSIAFATDRFTSDLNTMSIGAYQIALIDPQTGTITRVPGFAGGKHLNPQWSPDSKALYFLSDRDGIPNVYRVTLADGSLSQVTEVATGVSGITSTSPALSVASGKGVAALSVYAEGNYDIYTLDPTASAKAPSEILGNAAVLPPGERVRSEVSTLLNNATFGLPSTPYQTEPYQAKLKLESAAQAVGGVGVSRFGPTVGGGVSLFFSDMLENHLLGVGVGMNSGWNGTVSAKDIAAQVVYLNRVHRWNWGIVGSQIPYLSAGFASSISQGSNGDVLESDQLITYRQTERNASALISYPFDKARRVEVQGGLSQISFDQIVTTQTYSLITGRVISDSTQSMPLAETLTLGSSSAAYVFDTATYGATSPVNGQRYRLEASPTVGSLDFVGVLADYRRYFNPVPFYTIAVRGMSYGRYGSGGEDPRLFPLDLGYPGLVRGYDPYTFDARDCAGVGVTTDCPLVDKLLGSRMMVGSVELRFPLLRPFGVTRNMYGPLPVEVAFFGDTGVAWSSHETPSIFGGTRDGISSAGVAFRVNFMGFAVGEFDAVRPFDRPGRGWMFGFNLLQGW